MTIAAMPSREEFVLAFVRIGLGCEANAIASYELLSGKPDALSGAIAKCVRVILEETP